MIDWWIDSRQWRVAFLGAAFALVLAHVACAKPIGIVITKESTAHPDSTSIAFEFKRIHRQREVNTYFLLSGKGVRLTKFDPQVVVYYPDLPGNQITSVAQVALVDRLAADFRQTIDTYPKSAVFLKPHLELAEEVVRRVRAGEVYIEGAFMQRADYEKMTAQLERITETRDRQEEEEKRRKEELKRRPLIEERRRKR